ncbi:hypothetical protein GFJ94_03745 [Flavobacterium sp. LMO8]|uniref:hypothetical protein n=1 Tax=Flavobacterium sp. LMO8 TaxID=2654244 RepID=UPI0012929C42|nr:hypothetical protein [Flavobacterium sp. LMO8]MQP24174.1 hypothetical protein [Flavobacterium sp. LMO8]
MKKIFCLLIVFLSLSVFAQKNKQTTSDSISSPIFAKKNEIKIDVLNFIGNGRLGISYERFLNNNFSIGISGLTFNKASKVDNFINDDTRTMIEYQIIPYVRYAMSKSASNLYYIETFANINGGQFKELTTLNTGGIDYILVTKNDYNDLALGASIGYKLYFKECFVLDLTVGIGKNLFNNNSPSTISRLGLNLGYRF